MANEDRKEDAETQGDNESDEEEGSSEEETSSEDEGSGEDESSSEEEGSSEEDEGSSEDGESEEASASGADEGDEANESDESAEAEAPKPRARKAKPAEASEPEDMGDDVSAARVARALGIDDEEEAEEPEAAEVKEGEVVVNRAARRREEALERRRKRKGKAAPKDDEPELPRDKNARAKELLKRRREQSSTEKQPIALLPAEMVDDALSRSASAAGKWIRKNFNIIQWVVIAAAVGVGGFTLYTSQVEKTAAAATSALSSGVSAERGKVMAEDKRTDEEKEFDTTKVYKTADERTEAALAGYRKTMAEHPNTPAAMLAKLGEAGVLLEKRDWDGALAAYGAVLSSKLAATDIDVKGRAIEGTGMAKEGKGDLDGALASFKELEGVDARGYKELGLYQQGRVLLAKGDKDKAKDVLKMAREKLQAPSADGPKLRYLEEVVDESLRKIDPSLVPTKTPLLGGPKGGAITPEEMDKIRKQLEELAKKKGAEH